ncbi:MAG: septum formation initiator family protein [Thermoleophilia bacterium]|nr:septum formation initiator family protein [Thermoleophilia bacterium]
MAESTTTRVRTLGSRRLASVDWSNPVRRFFGQSRGVNWGVLFLALVIAMFLVRPLVMSGMSWHRTAALLNERRAEVASLERRNDRLTRRVEYYKTRTFIAEQAREYGMVEPGEQSYVIREIVHPESAAQYAISRLRNATIDSPVAIAAQD